MSKFIWCEDSKSGYQFWKALFKEVYPDYTIESKRSNSNLSRSVAQINDDGNTYFIMLDTAIDNPDVLREFTRLKKQVSGKTNVRVIKIHSFEFSLLSFEFLDQWVFAESDELRDKRHIILEARNRFVKLITSGGNADELNEFKSLYDYQDKLNSEKLSAKLLFDITRNTGFETDKSHVGPCFISSCCEWTDRQEDDICGLDDRRLTLSEKMEQLIKHSVLETAFKEAGIT